MDASLSKGMGRTNRIAGSEQQLGYLNAGGHRGVPHIILLQRVRSCPEQHSDNFSVAAVCRLYERQQLMIAAIWIRACSQQSLHLGQIAFAGRTAECSHRFFLLHEAQTPTRTKSKFALCTTAPVRTVTTREGRTYPSR